MVFLAVLLGLLTNGVALLVIWPINIVWTILAVDIHNRKGRQP